MNYASFIFENYHYEPATGEVLFEYSFDSVRRFTERVRVAKSDSYDHETLDRALQLAFILAGLSYYKTFPTSMLDLRNIQLTRSQAAFFSEVYRDGLSQFVYENKLNPEDIAQFEATETEARTTHASTGSGFLVLQSGGKDSLLLAELLREARVDFAPWYISSSEALPEVLRSVGDTYHRRRDLDTQALRQATDDGALNGHVPITFIIASYAILDAILLGKDRVLMAIGHEGEEPYTYIDEYAVRHQWSKTWHSEQLLASYVRENIAPNLNVGSPLRQFSELKISQLFSELCWDKYATKFASCNIANYRQGHDNTSLTWCARCAKCANSFLLFAAFRPPEDLMQLFDENLFEVVELEDDFRGLLGIDDSVKPFECVGETDELRKAYEFALANGYTPLPFEVPASAFDENVRYESQSWASDTIEQ